MKRWPTKPLGEVAEFINGRAFKPTDWSKNGVPIIRIQNLTDPKASANRFEGAFQARHAVKDGDLLVSWSATLDVYFWNGGDAVLNQHIFRAIPDSSLVSKAYLFYALKSVMDELRSKTHGATMKHITKGPFERTMIPVPPLVEQERIVDLLDEVNELWKLRVQADHRCVALIPALFHEMFGDPDTNPKRLPIVPLGSLLSIRTGKLDSNAAVTNGAYPFFTCSREDARIDTFAFDCEALLLAGNNAVGEYSVKHYKGKFNAYQRTYVLNLLNADHSYGFMQQALQLRLQELKRLSLGTSTKYLTLGILKNIEIPLPDSALQGEFARRVAEIRELEAGQATSRTRLDALFQSMLHRAFNGEL